MARGQLRIYLGAAPGVGKTYTMLEEAHRRAERGTDIVVGYVDTHGRAHTAAMVGGLEIIPRRKLTYRGSEFEELDLDAVLARRPRERVVVALTGGPEGETLIRRAARIAARTRGADLMAVHVARSDGLAGADPAHLARQRILTESLGGTYHEVIGADVPEALLAFARGANATQIVLGASRRARVAQLLSPWVGVTTTARSGAIDVHLVAHERAAAGRRSGRVPAALSRRRRLVGWALTAVGLPVLTLALTVVPGLSLTNDILIFLLAVVGVALVGGMSPALVAAVFGSLLLNWFFTPPTRTFKIADVDNLLALGVFIVVAAAMSAVVDVAARRTALLAAVSHDLRTPLASAKAAVASLRSPDVAFDDTDRAELLANADESLDRLAGLVANLLDMSRLQAGALGMTPVVLGLEEVVPRALDELGERARAVAVHIPTDLAVVRADPGLLERVLVNVIGNALRFSPVSSPPVTTGSALGSTVELRVIDHGPGVAAELWDGMFQPFQRLGDRDNHSGVGLGLALSRGLAEAMGGNLRPEATPGGGLTMVLTLPGAEA